MQELNDKYKMKSAQQNINENKKNPSYKKSIYTNVATSFNRGSIWMQF